MESALFPKQLISKQTFGIQPFVSQEVPVHWRYLKWKVFFPSWVSLLWLCYSQHLHTATFPWVKWRAPPSSPCVNKELPPSSDHEEWSVFRFTGTEKSPRHGMAKRNLHFHLNLVKCRNTKAETKLSPFKTDHLYPSKPDLLSFTSHPLNQGVAAICSNSQEDTEFAKEVYNEKFIT